MIRFRRILIGIAAAAAAESAAAACGAAPRSPSAVPVPAAPTPAAREVRFTQEIPDVAWLVEIREGGRAGGGRPRSATGAVRITTGDVNRAGIERDYGCRAQSTDTRPAAWACVVPFRRGAPDWAALLARLDALGVMAPPPGRDPAPAGDQASSVCGDYAFWALEVRVGGATAVRDAQGCGPVSPRRAAFEAGVDSVLAAIDAAARVRR